MYWDKSRMWDSTVAFYRNGGVKQVYSNRNNRRLEQSFEENGALETTERTTHFPMRTFREMWTGKNVKVSTERIDTLERTSNPAVIIFDTLYFPNGKVYKTEAHPSNQITFGAIYYKADGTVDYVKPADSLKLRTFKDNVDCFYGLVNGRGDTVVKAQFDRIDAVEDYAWAAHSGDLITLFDRKSAPIKPFAKQLTGFSKLDNFDFEKEDARKTMPTYEETFFKSIRPKKSFFAFQDADKYGVIDNKWTVVLPPQYFEMSNELIDNGRFIQYEKKQNETSALASAIWTATATCCSTIGLKTSFTRGSTTIFF